jgi:hypothetical protein
MSTLYQLSEEAHGAMVNMKAMLDREDIDESTYEDTMEALTGELTDKVVNVGLHIKNLRSDAQGLKDAISEFQKRLKSIQSNIDFYEHYLFKHMEANNIDKAGNEYIDIKFKKLPPAAAINTYAVIPDKYSRIVPESSAPDKKKILDALKAGEELDFAELITGRTALSIK